MLVASYEQPSVFSGFSGGLSAKPYLCVRRLVFHSWGPEKSKLSGGKYLCVGIKIDKFGLVSHWWCVVLISWRMVSCDALWCSYTVRLEDCA